MSNVPSKLRVDHRMSMAEVTARQAAEGFKELPRHEQRTLLRIGLKSCASRCWRCCSAAALIYLLLGDLKEALILLVFATMSVAITVVQESRTERVLEALRDLTSPRALVIRDGQRKRIAGRDVVRGDIVVLGEGDRVPADAVLIESHDLQTDESLLTGESVPVRKDAAVDGARDAAAIDPGGDDLPFVFSGSLVVRGTGIGEVTAIGHGSEIGRIGQSLSDTGDRTPAAGADRARLVRVFAMLGGASALLAVVLYGMLRGGWLDAVLPASHWACRCCRKNSPWCSPSICDGCLAHFAGARADATLAGHRDARVGDSAVHGQNRHVDREPHDRCRMRLPDGQTFQHDGADTQAAGRVP